MTLVRDQPSAVADGVGEWPHNALNRGVQPKTRNQALPLCSESGHHRRMDFGARWKAAREILWGHWWFRIALIIWAVFSGYDTFSGVVSQAFPAFELNPLGTLIVGASRLLPWWGWLVILQALLVCSVVEYVLRHVKRLEDAQATPSASPAAPAEPPRAELKSAPNVNLPPITKPITEPSAPLAMVPRLTGLKDLPVGRLGLLSPAFLELGSHEKEGRQQLKVQALGRSVSPINGGGKIVVITATIENLTGSRIDGCYITVWSMERDGVLIAVDKRVAVHGDEIATSLLPRSRKSTIILYRRYDVSPEEPVKLNLRSHNALTPRPEVTLEDNAVYQVNLIIGGGDVETRAAVSVKVGEYEDLTVRHLGQVGVRLPR